MVCYELVKVLSSLYFFKPYTLYKDKLSCEPFFILGSGRNGSTLLASTLSQIKIFIYLQSSLFYLMLS